MSTASTEVLGKAARAKSKGAPATKALEPRTIRAIVEAGMVGCGQYLRHTLTAEAAYYRAERRGFKPGHELEDWLAAEAEIRSLWARAFEEAPLHCGR
jgi:hypothetical protein